MRPRYAEFFQTHQPEVRSVIEETELVGDLAYVRGRTLGMIRGLGGIGDQAIDDVFLMILRKTDGADWEISRLMWHAAAGGD